jgi:hypothetical protein
MLYAFHCPQCAVANPEKLIARWAVYIILLNCVFKHTVACLLKTRIVKAAEGAVARERLCNTPVARQWLSTVTWWPQQART